MKNCLLKILLAVALCSTSACFNTANPYVADGVYGGIGGAAVGAGTGALIGAAIKNGSIGKSALLGTAIGLPAGVAAGVAYRSYRENKIVNTNNETIETNARILKDRRDQIDSLREELIDESFSIHPDDSNPLFIYTGPTIGTYQ